MTEAQHQRGIIELAQLTGWMVAHFRPAQTSKGWRTAVSGDGKGFPDLVLVHPHRGILYRELKTDTGKLTPEQRAWGQRIAEAGGDHDVWRPRDWWLIEATLRGTR